MSERTGKAVGDIMSHDVVTISTGATVAEAVRLLAERSAPCAIVLDDKGRPSGIVTESDLLALARDGEEVRVAHVLEAMLMEEHHFFDAFRKVRKAAGVKVEDVMSSPVTCVALETPVTEAAGIMVTHDYRQLPVLKDGRLVGIVTRQHIVATLAEHG